MSPTELSEHEQSKALPNPTEQHLLAEPEHPKGSPARTVIVILIVLAAVGGAIWKIRKNASEQTTQGNRQAAAADRPIPVTTAAVQQKTAYEIGHCDWSSDVCSSDLESDGLPPPPGGCPA